MRVFTELPLDGEAIHRIGGKDLCALLDLSSGALTDLKKRGIAVHLGHDAYDLEATVRAYVRSLRSVAAGWGTEDQAATLTTERARLAREQADAQAIKNAKLRGELVEAAAVESAWADVLRQVRARILAVPPRLRQVLDLGHGDAETIDRELRDALSELGHADD
jgi:phage terminase Nu1 subunit (DNA packaging protein)